MLSLEESNRLITENYDDVVSVAESLCRKYNVPQCMEDDVLSLCHDVVVNVTSKWNPELSKLSTFWYLCCERRFFSKYRKLANPYYHSQLDPSIPYPDKDPILSLEGKTSQFSNLERSIANDLRRGMNVGEILKKYRITHKRYKLIIRSIRSKISNE